MTPTHLSVCREFRYGSPVSVLAFAVAANGIAAAADSVYLTVDEGRWEMTSTNQKLVMGPSLMAGAAGLAHFTNRNGGQVFVLDLLELSAGAATPAQAATQFVSYFTDLPVGLPTLPDDDRVITAVFATYEPGVGTIAIASVFASRSATVEVETVSDPNQRITVLAGWPPSDALQLSSALSSPETRACAAALAVCEMADHTEIKPGVFGVRGPAQARWWSEVGTGHRTITCR